MSNCGACGCHEALIINQCDDYRFEDGRQFCVDSKGCTWPDNLQSAELQINPVNPGCACPFNTAGCLPGTITTDDCGVTRVCFEMDCKQTCALMKGTHVYNYRLVALTEAGGRITLDKGHISVR